jgi:hypothetical protein
VNAPGSPPWSRASAPIWAHVSGYAPRFRENAPLAFLRAFSDDSAGETGDRRLFMAGYLHRAAQWALFSEAWDEELRATPSIDYLKMSEANSFRDQFERRKGWTEQKRDEKLRGLARVIRHFAPISFQFSIGRKVYENDLTPVSPRGLGVPHFVGCFGVVSGLARYVASQGIKVPIEFIFDEQQGVDADINLFFSHMKKSIPKNARNLIDGVPIFKNDKDKLFLPLQAADMLAWHLRREHEFCVLPNTLPMADLLRNNLGHIVWEAGDDMIRSWANHHSKLPGISQLQSKGQWRAIKGEIARLSSLGIDSSTVGHRKNIFQRTRERIVRLFRS